jgi:lipid-binding SYLF domain-containing protein
MMTFPSLRQESYECGDSSPRIESERDGIRTLRAGAATDLKLNAQILSYSRSKGLFVGLELKGVVIMPDKDDMRYVYGEGVTAKEVLMENKVTASVAARAFPNTLGRYSSRVAKK